MNVVALPSIRLSTLSPRLAAVGATGLPWYSGSARMVVATRCCCALAMSARRLSIRARPKALPGCSPHSSAHESWGGIDAVGGISIADAVVAMAQKKQVATTKL
jgi:hypothetical protein